MSKGPTNEDGTSSSVALLQTYSIIRWNTSILECHVYLFQEYIDTQSRAILVKIYSRWQEKIRYK